MDELGKNRFWSFASLFFGSTTSSSSSSFPFCFVRYCNNADIKPTNSKLSAMGALLFELMIMPSPKFDFVIKIQFQNRCFSSMSNCKWRVDEFRGSNAKMYIQFQTIELSQPKFMRIQALAQAHAQINYKSLNIMCVYDFFDVVVAAAVHILVQWSAIITLMLSSGILCNWKACTINLIWPKVGVR